MISIALLQVHRIQGIVFHFGQFVKALLGLLLRQFTWALKWYYL